MTIKEIMEQLQQMLNDGVSEDTRAAILDNRGIQVSRIEKLELENNTVYVVQSR